MGRRRQRADRVIHVKETSARGLIREVVIWRVPRSIRYPSGIKYRLILVDPKTRTLLLMDNHWPKGPHIHRGGVELPYEFRSVRTLVRDFRLWGEEEERSYENKANQD